MSSWLDDVLEEGEQAARLRNDFPYFAGTCLKIRAESGELVSLAFNRAQRFIWEKLEKQFKETGKIRAVICKSRQQGASTLTAGLLYWLATRRRGQRGYVVAHRQQSVADLYGIVLRMHSNMPEEWKPKTGASSANELVFEELDSGYRVGSAGSEGLARGSTLQFAHLSEVAFWGEGAEDHVAGLLQAVPDLPGTAVIIESTAIAMGDTFHRLWNNAESGASDFISIFTPWSWSDKYQEAKLPDGFELTDIERDYAKEHELTPRQVAWRRRKIVQMGENKFKSEFPINAVECFQFSESELAFIPGELVARARRSKLVGNGKLLIGFDPAYAESGDCAAMAWRKGREIVKVEKRRGLNAMACAGWLKAVIDAEKPAAVYVDTTGVGAVADRLCEQGYGKIVHSVVFSGKAQEQQRMDTDGRMIGGFQNRRAEMYHRLLEALQSEEGLKLPNNDELHADLTCFTSRHDSSGRMVLESKDVIRRKLGRSPDLADAVALTFADGLFASGGPSGRDPHFNRKLVYPKVGWR